MASSSGSSAHPNNELRFDILDPSGVQAQHGSSDMTPLQESCRAKILKSVGLQRLARMTELPLPQSMVNVLMDQLTVDDFFVNRNNVTGEDMNNCVYQGKCLLDDTDVVLKCIPPCLASEDVTISASLWEHLRHPNLMQYLAKFSQDGTQVIVFHSYKHSLADILYERQSRMKIIPERLVWKAFKELCSVVKYLVENQVSYEKLKPERISFDKEGVLKLESGLLHGAGSDNFGMQMAMASPEAVYTPPEILEGQTFSAKSHVWILGCLLVELASLEPAFPVFDGNIFGAMSSIMEGSPSGVEELTGTLQETVQKCLINDPDDRATISELLAIANIETEKSKFTDEKIWDY